jgi:hypothetical protein
MKYQFQVDSKLAVLNTNLPIALVNCKSGNAPHAPENIRLPELTVAYGAVMDICAVLADTTQTLEQTSLRYRLLFYILCLNILSIDVRDHDGSGISGLGAGVLPLRLNSRVVRRSVQRARKVLALVPTAKEICKTRYGIEFVDRFT